MDWRLDVPDSSGGFLAQGKPGIRMESLQQSGRMLPVAVGRTFLFSNVTSLEATETDGPKLQAATSNVYVHRCP